MEISTKPLGRVTCSLMIVMLSVCFGSNFQFYSNSVISNLAGMGQQYMNYSYHFHYSRYISDNSMSLLWSFSSAALQLGCLFGAMVTRLLGDRYGRRKALMILSVAAAVGSLFDGLAKTAYSFEIFIIGRLLMGLALGGGLPLASMFISEIAPVRYRGACGSTQQLFIGLGNLVSYILTLSQVWGNAWGWPISVSLPPFIGAATQFLVLMFYAHDSPRELVLSQNNLDQGLAALKFYQGKAAAEVTLEAIKNEKRALESGKQEEFRFTDVFRQPETRQPLAIALLLVFAAQMTGVAAVFAYSKTMFTQAGLDGETAQYASIGLGFCNCFSPLFTIFLVERAGRKATLIGGLLTADVALIALTVCLFGTNVFHWHGAAMGALPCLFIFQIGYAFTNSIVLIAPAELFPQKVRASAMTVAFVFLWFLQTVVVMGYLPFSKLVGVCYSYIPFILGVTLSIVLVAIFMPETKGKTVEQVAAIFARKPVWDSALEEQRRSVLKL